MCVMPIDQVVTMPMDYLANAIDKVAIMPMHYVANAHGLCVMPMDYVTNAHKPSGYSAHGLCD